VTEYRGRAVELVEAEDVLGACTDVAVAAVVVERSRERVGSRIEAGVPEEVDVGSGALAEAVEIEPTPIGSHVGLPAVRA
jgi:hypothetical protein